jgi:hypothetical protein
MRGPYDRVDHDLMRMIDEIMRQKPTASVSAGRGRRTDPVDKAVKEAERIMGNPRHTPKH